MKKADKRSAAFDVRVSCEFRDCSKILDAKHGLRWRQLYGVFAIMRLGEKRRQLNARGSVRQEQCLHIIQQIVTA